MQQWEPAAPEYTNGTLPGRNPEHYVRVLEQFNVKTAARYQPEKGATFCNIFVQDCLQALGVHPGHWWNGDELSANGLGKWFRTRGMEYGWHRCDVEHAKAAANAGRPTVAIWENQGGIGHVAMVLPTVDKDALHIAQAGRRNLWDEPIQAGFGEFTPLVVFYSHA